MQARSLICVAVLSVVMGWDAPAKAAEILGGLNSTAKAQTPMAQERNEEVVLSNTIEVDHPAKGPMIVVVEQERHITHVLQNHGGQLKEIFSAANTTGKKSTPTPNGRMLIANKRWDPEWTPPVSIDPHQKKVESWSKTHHNPLGVAWMGLNTGFVGLHGTNSPKMIGRYASHGCVRHKNEDIKKLFSLVPVGTPVYIVQKYAGTKLQDGDAQYLSMIERTKPQMVAQLHHIDAPTLSN